MGRRTCRWGATGRTRPTFAVPYAHSGRVRVRVRVRVAALLAECLICVSVSLQCGRLSVSLASTPTARCPVAGQTSRHLPACRWAEVRHASIRWKKEQGWEEEDAVLSGKLLDWRAWEVAV